MTPVSTGRKHRRAGLLAAVFAVALCCASSVPPSAASTAPGRQPVAAASPGLADRAWVWPASSFRLQRPYVQPAHAYGPGHRGIDLRLVDSTALRSPSDGVVAFSGAVAGRGILTIDHGDGLVTTLEPVDSAMSPGDPVARGEDVATLSIGGHAAPGDVHFGVRLHGEYINPMLLLGGVPRAVLLPCCD